jgi:hypothetical protein
VQQAIDSSKEVAGWKGYEEEEEENLPSSRSIHLSRNYNYTIWDLNLLFIFI